MRAFINDFLKDKLDNFLHKNPEIAQTIENKIKQSEKERKDLAGIRKIARERSKKANLHNKKLRDCRVHLTDLKNERRKKLLYSLPKEILQVVRLRNLGM